MRRLWVLPILLLLFTFLSGCSDEKVVAPIPSDSPNSSAITIDPEAVAVELVSRAGWEVTMDEDLPARFKDLQAATPAGNILTSERQVIVDDIVHYSFQVRVGSGPYDVIGLHRVVKEKKPGDPIKAKETVFLQHGDAIGFVKFIFGAAAPSVPDDHGSAIFLAQHGVDVWGIDQPWVLVPYGIADFSFMANWGIGYEIDVLRIGLGIARSSRAMTGSGYGKMNLLGYSSGAFLGYSYVDYETQLPPGLRHVSGYIPVDCMIKDNDAFNRQGACGTAQFYKDMLDTGVYQDEGSYLLFYLMGTWAQTDPDGDSPVFPGYTNLQAALLVGASTYVLAPFPPSWHYVAGVYDEAGVPTGLQYTTVPGYLDFVVFASPYEPSLFLYDIYALWCDEEDSPYDDHLSEITVPIFYVGANGGIGTAGIYSTTIVGSTDVTTLIVSLHPAEEIALDFGHIDIFTAENAPSLVWQPMYNWIKAHTEHGQGKGDMTMK